MNINIILGESSHSLTGDGIITLGLGILTFFISILTIKMTKNQFSEDKRMSIKPYFNSNIQYLSSDEISLYNNFEKYRDSLKVIKIKKLIPIKEEKLSTETVYQFKLKLDNIGLGHARNCEIVKITGNIDGETRNYYIGTIQKDETIYVDMCFSHYIFKVYTKLVNTTYDSFYDYKQLNLEVSEETVEYIYVDLKYHDLFDNEYVKTICIKLYISLNFKEDKNRLLYIDRLSKVIEIVEEESIEDFKVDKFKKFKKYRIQFKKNRLRRKNETMRTKNIIDIINKHEEKYKQTSI